MLCGNTNKFIRTDYAQVDLGGWLTDHGEVLTMSE